MITVGDAVATVEENLLVDRTRELQVLRDWLFNDEPTAELLNISGPPGVGKTTLVHAFVREARALGWNVAVADGHFVGPSDRDLVRALSGGRSEAVEVLVSRLNKRSSLVVIDTFEQLEHLTTFLQEELLPRLNTGTRVLIAGRRPLVLAWARGDGWPKIVRLLPLEGFSSSDSRVYLVRRGIAMPELINQVMAETTGNPLALSLAADLVSQLGIREFANHPQWRLAARALVRRLLSEASGDASLVAAIEAGSVVRIFDEATLYAITCDDNVSQVFDRLCRLSIIKPAANGLMLHDHVRAIIAKDLRWRRPRQYQLLRQRALGHFKDRLRGSSEAERGWLIAECFHLWDNPIIQEIFFGGETPGNVAVGPAARPDRELAIELYSKGSQYKSQLEQDSQLLSDALAYPDTRFRAATGDGGALIGFSMVVPLCRESIGILARHPMHANLINAHFGPTGWTMLPARPQDATAHYLLPVVASSDQKGAVYCALFRELAAIFGLNGTYLCMNRDAAMDRLLTECNFQMVTESKQAGVTAKGWILDLTRIGFDGWIQAVVDGRQAQPPPSSHDLEAEILSALTHWTDTAWLAANCHVVAPGAGTTERAAATRQAIIAAFSQARAGADGSVDKALRALELAYLKRTASHKQAMRSLLVSRATFYRLCKRGVGTLAEHVVRA